MAHRAAEQGLPKRGEIAPRNFRKRSSVFRRTAARCSLLGDGGPRQRNAIGLGRVGRGVQPIRSANA
jgi:hypothetical protein